MLFPNPFSKFQPIKKWQRRRARQEELARLTPLVSQLLTAVDIAEHADPAFSTELAFKLYRKTRVDIVTAKTDRTPSRSSEPFDRFLEALRTGTDTLPGPDTRHVLTTANDFLDDPTPIGKTGLDVGSHFRMSSSFAGKGRILYTAARCFRARRMLEIGTAYGMSAQFLMLSASRYAGQGSTLTTVEAGEPQFSMAQQSLASSFPERVQCHRGLSGDVLPTLAENDPDIAFDLVFHDGAHDGRVYREDFDRLKPMLRPGSLVIFDDIHWYDRRFANQDPGCYEGWRAIVDDNRVARAAELNGRIGVALID